MPTLTSASGRTVVVVTQIGATGETVITAVQDGRTVLAHTVGAEQS